MAARASRREPPSDAAQSAPRRSWIPAAAAGHCGFDNIEMDIPSHTIHDCSRLQYTIIEGY